jgi:NADPH:quinone reductase-like Zn-dependent oxidoreductase
MRAAVYHQFGGPEVVYVADVPIPIPKSNEVQVALFATTVNSADSRLRSLDVPRGFGLIIRLLLGPFKPRKPILGVDGVGTVSAVGSKVTTFKVGDRVAVCPGIRLGCHAEFMCLPEKGLIASIPPGLDFSNAAGLLFGGTTALVFLREKVRLRAGQKILIIGASGAVGVCAVQIARSLGGKVTAVCSEGNSALVRSLGASEVIDYQSGEYLTSDTKYDAILDCVGATHFSEVRASLLPEGKYVPLVASLPEMLSGVMQSLGSGPKVVSGDAQITRQIIIDLLEMGAKGIVQSVIDRTVPLDQIKAAHERVDSKRKRGAVVVLMSPDAGSESNKV